MEAEARRAEDRDVVWCPRCGIPHPTTATYCSHCGQQLREEGEVAGAVQPTSVEPTVATGELVTPTETPPLAPGEPAAEGGPPDWLVSPAPEPPAQKPAAARMMRLPRRPEPTSDAEIEAQAAAIVAQARALDQARERSPAVEQPQPPATPRPETAADADGEWPVIAPAPSASPPSLFAAMPERERIWLIAGIVLCALLVLFAIALARNLAGAG